MDDPIPATTTGFANEDLVYVDPDARTVVGKVEWGKNGNPKSLAVPEKAPEPVDGKPGRRRGFGRKYFPWGTYRSMKRIYQLEGKQGKKSNPDATLDDVLEKALKEPYWD